jgi:hypothetical protein
MHRQTLQQLLINKHLKYSLAMQRPQEHTTVRVFECNPRVAATDAAGACASVHQRTSCAAAASATITRCQWCNNCPPGSISMLLPVHCCEAQEQTSLQNLALLHHRLLPCPASRVRATYGSESGRKVGHLVLRQHAGHCHTGILYKSLPAATLNFLPLLLPLLLSPALLLPLLCAPLLCDCSYESSPPALVLLWRRATYG